MIIKIKDIKRESIHKVGTKAYQISRLLKLGYHVCSGYVITTDLFIAYCKYNQIKVNDDKLPEKILRGKFDGVLIKKLQAIFEELSVITGAIIVRSSALEEDGLSTSYAGIFESVMHVKSDEDMILAIKKVWASYYSPIAKQYAHDVERHIPAMSVLIQCMIDCVKSGVTFTRHPITRQNEVVTEACWGNNQGITGGDEKDYVTPAKGMTKHQKVLTKREQKRIKIISKQLELDFLYPCDFEWGIKDGILWIFQVRPISRCNEGNVYGKVSIDNLNCILLDRYAQPATVCYLSLLESWQNRVYLSIYNNHHGLDFDEQPLCFLHNRVYWNVHYQKKYFEDDGKNRFLKRIQFYRIACNGYKSWYRRLQTYNKKITHYMHKIHHTHHDHDLLALLEDVIDNFCVFIGIDHFRFLGLAQILYDDLEKTCLHHDYDKHQIAQLIGKQTNGNKTVLANNELLELTRLIHDHDKLNLFFSQNTAEEILQEIQHNQAYAYILSRFNAFILKHGHRGTECDDLYYTHWVEEPSKVVALMKQLIRNDILCQTDDDQHIDPEQIKRNLIKTISKQHKGIGKLWYGHKLKKRITLTGEYMCLRENQRYYFDKSWLLIRQILLKISKYYRAKGVIQNSEDIFHMKIDEIKEGILYPNYLMNKDIINTRRDNYEQAKKDKPPYIIKNSVHVSVQKTGNFKSYKVMGISGGKAVGKIKIINSLDDLGQVERGDIGVVKTFHPSWTPILKIANGLIMNYGNMLSHGAVVAREYGIPVVVFNDDATTVFHNGEWVEINGTTGRIKLMNVMDVKR
ncbi:hypothetical protein HZI73_05910 [Vallitalea pronyensis]|uniref:Phosphoenolpyruvate synthase n=1 Tax=Vallitalea pronyensis TaxID=1348613 RepID=A0A8J8MI44_9FIRM|nr:PEP/pyruvate-binding domain-containing protein [Vallitalea pronyensis]QUI21862.1 hypothetical protein HZI73_05910 [Vallitalea pronyensis]